VKRPFKRPFKRKWSAAKALTSMSSMVSAQGPTVDQRAVQKYGKPSSFSLTKTAGTKHVTLRYVANREMNGAAGAGDVWNIRANGCHDPDQTGTGHQPYGWDTYKTLYNHYTVLSSKIQVSIVSSAATGSYGPPYFAVLSLNDGALAAAAYTDAFTRAEAGNCAYGFAITDGVSKAITRFKKGFVASKFYGVEAPEDKDSLGAAVGADPSELAYFSLQLTAPDSGDPIVCNVMATVDYEVLLQEPTQLTVS